jgi:hypothetical protein
MRITAGIVTAPIITAWMPRGRRVTADDIVKPAYRRPQTASEVKRYMREHLAELRGDDE